VLTLESVREGDVHRLTLLGEFDLSAAGAFEAEVRRVEATDAARIVVDMSHLQ
jgi:anti-anti-sigma regulatory factor